MFCLNSFWRDATADVHDINGSQIDTLRLLLLEFDAVDDLELTLRPFLTTSFKFYVIKSLNTVEWLWNHAALAFHGTELVCFRAELVRMLVCSYEVDFDENNERHELLVKLMDDQMVTEYLKGTYTLLPLLVVYCKSVDSQWLGEAFLALLANLNLDVDACMAMELERYPGGLVVRKRFGEERRVIFEKNQTQGQILRWEWVCDPHSPGYHVASEFNALAGDADYLSDFSEWPFPDYYQYDHTHQYIQQRELDQVQRFDRRTASKARKERARTGQKPLRSKMSGTWDW
jgi:hypothetical protein